jgi:RNA polymerase sigma-70 factor (ECF subfamily)
MTTTFDDSFRGLFQTEFPRLYRYLDRLSGEPDLAADLAQEAFVRLYRRGAMPDRPGIWLITVALNLFRNVRSTDSRRRRLLTVARAESILSEPPPSPAQVNDATGEYDRVRRAMNHLPERERQMLLLRAEGYSYRDIAAAVNVKEASIGTLLARAKRTFREVYQERTDAS